MFKNKHVIVAVIVAPILAILSYLGVDQLVSEKPHAAMQDASYPLAAKSGCRYASGECRLENGEVKITLKPGIATGAGTSIELVSSLPIDGARVAVVNGSEESEPVSFVAEDKDQRIWSVDISRAASETSLLRLVVSSGDSVFFAEVESVFLHQSGQTTQR